MSTVWVKGADAIGGARGGACGCRPIELPPLNIAQTYTRDRVGPKHRAGKLLLVWRKEECRGKEILRGERLERSQED